MKLSEIPAIAPAQRAPWLDRAAILLSGLCVVHCIATTLAVLLLASVGAVLLDPRIHEIGLMLAILVGAIALGAGFRAHGSPAPLVIGLCGLSLMALGVALPEGVAETGATVVGVSILAVAHLLNQRARIR
jgi:hypothetical protein